MIRAQHRSSKDVDAFIDDPQYLGFLSPRLAAEEIWACETYEESANHLRLVFPEGEVDFIAAPKITSLPSQLKLMEVEEDGATLRLNIDIEHPVEIALKKLVYRNSMLKVRDMFDIAVVEALFPDLLRANLHHVTGIKAALVRRLDAVSDQFFLLEIDELDIADKWRDLATSCRRRVGELAAGIPR